MRFMAPTNLSLRKQGTARPEAGWYVYSGSAKGPGGLRSRLRHHFRKTKKSHWHVDQLTTQCVDLAALSVIDGDECHFINRQLRTIRLQHAMQALWQHRLQVLRKSPPAVQLLNPNTCLSCQSVIGVCPESRASLPESSQGSKRVIGWLA